MYSLYCQKTSVSSPTDLWREFFGSTINPSRREPLPAKSKLPRLLVTAAGGSTARPQPSGSPFAIIGFRRAGRNGRCRVHGRTASGRLCAATRAPDVRDRVPSRRAYLPHREGHFPGRPGEAASPRRQLPMPVLPVLLQAGGSHRRQGPALQQPGDPQGHGSRARGQDDVHQPAEPPGTRLQRNAGQVHRVEVVP